MAIKDSRGSEERWALLACGGSAGYQAQQDHLDRRADQCVK